MRTLQEFAFDWQGIAVTVTYCPDYCEIVREIEGYVLAHIEVKAETCLPITETGYRSIWLPNDEVEEQGGVVALVTLLLDITAEAHQWQHYIREKRQLSLF